MDTRNLRTFILIAEIGSFTKAAEILGYAQSTITAQIHRLEEETGAPLFDRINKVVSLTEHGKKVQAQAQQILKIEEMMSQKSDPSQPVSGTVRIAMVDSLLGLFLNERYPEFSEKYPKINLKIDAAGTDEMFKLLNHNEVDLIFTLDSHVYSADYLIASEECIDTHFVASSKSPLAKKERLHVKDLLGEQFLLTEKDMSYRRLLDKELATRSMEITPILEIGDVRHICKLVETGAGLSFIPDYASDEGVNSGLLVRLPVTDIDIKLWKQMIYHRDKWISPAMQAVIDHWS